MRPVPLACYVPAAVQCPDLRASPPAAPLDLVVTVCGVPVCQSVIHAQRFSHLPLPPRLAVVQLRATCGDDSTL